MSLVQKRKAAAGGILSALALISTIAVLIISLRDEIEIINNRHIACMAIPIAIFLTCAIYILWIIASILVIQSTVDENKNDIEGGDILAISLFPIVALVITIVIQSGAKFIIVPETPMETLYCIYQYVCCIAIACFVICIAGFVIYAAIILPSYWVITKCCSKKLMDGCAEVFNCNKQQYVSAEPENQIHIIVP